MCEKWHKNRSAKLTQIAYQVILTKIMKIEFTFYIIKQMIIV